MIVIPEQLRQHGFRFIKVGNQKVPAEKGWNKDGGTNYQWDDEKFLKYLKTAKYYGVATGRGKLLIIDIEKEHKDIAYELKSKLPNTFIVRTPSGGWHFYYIVSNFKEKIILLKAISWDKEGKPKKSVHYGELQWKGQQCLGPGSSYTSGQIKYKVDNDVPIVSVKNSKIIDVIAPYYTPVKKVKFVSNSGEGRQSWDIGKITIPELTDKSNDGIFRGSHPIHGSTSGKNFEVDVEKGLWHCYRCGTGGDAVTLVALLEGIVSCEECVKGNFSKDKKAYLETIKVGVKKYKFENGDKDGYGSIYNQTGAGITVFGAPIKRGELQVQKIVELIKNKYDFIVIRDATGRQPHIYVYDEGYYKLNGEDIIINEFKEILNSQKIPWKELYKRELLGYIKTENLVDREDIVSPDHLINLNNTVYNLKTRRCQQHSHEYFFLYKLPWDYNYRATCPKIMKYLKSTLQSEHIIFTQELFGYCLSPDYSHHGIFYLFGTGGNGKGVWTDLLQALVGRHGYVSKSINSLSSNRFATAQLYGKLVNICGELSRDTLNDTDTLKKLSAGDSIQAEFKNKDGFDFKNKAKIITSCNRIPECDDTSYGWYRRQYILPFLKQFSDSKKEIVALQKQLIVKNEMEGLLKWALEGLIRLRKQKKFSYPKERQELYIKYQQNTTYFLKENYLRTIEFDDKIINHMLYQHYSIWCKTNSIPVASKIALSYALDKFLKAPPVEEIDEKTGKKICFRRYIKKVK